MCILGYVSCDREAGCWSVYGAKGTTAGCIDLVIALTTRVDPENALTCTLEYQGYGVCEQTDIGIVCFSCTPSSSSRLKAFWQVEPVGAILSPMDIVFNCFTTLLLCIGTDTVIYLFT